MSVKLNECGDYCVFNPASLFLASSTSGRPGSASFKKLGITPQFRKVESQVNSSLVASRFSVGETGVSSEGSNRVPHSQLNSCASRLYELHL